MSLVFRKHSLFDGCPSEVGLRPSQFRTQPANFWFQDLPPPQPHPTGAVRDRGVLSDDEQSPTTDQPDGGPVRPKPEKPATSPLDGLPGAGTVLAVLDTGIAYNHLAFSSTHLEVEFTDKVLECKNFISSDENEDCEDVNGHGTQCAGIACGLSFSGESEGKEKERGREGGDTYYPFNSPAPGARLLVCKIGHNETDDEEASIRAINVALDYIISYNEKTENSERKVDVISLSFGFDYFDGELAKRVQEAVSRGIIVVCCASNDGSKLPNPISYPARLGNVLCIGACDKYGSPTQFTSRGREIDFLELGEEVWAPTLGLGGNCIKSVKGTSFSTPSVAGLICRLLQDLRRLSRGAPDAPWLYDRMHNVWCMRELLKGMSVMQGHHDTARGYGKLIPQQYFKKGDEERVRMCKEILGVK